MTLLIKNVQILGGVKDFPEGSDVFVNGERISAIGKFPKKPADVVLDGQGAYLSPGFIDVNTDSDHYLTLFDNPSQEDFLKQGVTTIFGGMCGASLAPLLYGGLESFRKWGDTDRINVNWHTMADFLHTLDKRPLAVNFGTLVGHSTIRRAIVGDALRDLTKNEMGVFGATLTAALAEGGFGLSTGLSYVHSQKTSYAELRFLADIVKKEKGIYATHLRHTGVGVKASVEETIKLAKDAGVTTLISHFTPENDARKEYADALEMIEQLPRDVHVKFDLYPSESTLFPLYTFLPSWVQTGGIDVMLANVKDEWLAPRIKNDLPVLDEEHFFVAQAPGNDSLVGKSLRELRDIYGISDSREALLHFMTVVNMRGVVMYRHLDAGLIKRAITSPHSFIASNAPSFEEKSVRRLMKSERTTSTFIKFLSLVQDQNIMPLNDAIRKITLAPALMFGLVGRGEIKEGNFADLVCFKGSEVKFTLVNGAVVEKDGQFQNKFTGKALRHVAQ